MAAYSRKRQPEPQPYYALGSPTLLAETPANANERPPTRAEAQKWETLYQHVESRRQALWNWRLAHWSTWSKIARYEAPWRYYAFVESNLYNNGLLKDQNIIDRTATIAGEVCANGMMQGVTDPDGDWVKLGPAIPDFDLDRQGQRYYEDVTERLNYIYDHSNFYEAQAQHNEDAVFFGTSPIIDYESRDNIIHVRVPCAGEYFLGNGFNNQSEVLAEEFRFTVSQIVEMFGVDNCPQDILSMWAEKGGALEYESVIGHLIEPNFAIGGDDEDDAEAVVPGGFTWRETFWIRGRKDARPLSLTGFHEQPFAALRWATQGNDPYGRGIGEKNLGDTIQLQLETRQKAESIEKVNRPPMGADVSLQNLPASTNPGKITYFNTMNGEKKFFPLYEVKPDIPAITADIEIIQNRIRETAHNKAFQVIQNLRQEVRGQVTATEIDKLSEEGLMELGGVILRAHGTLRQRVRRHLAIMARRGIMPRKPASLRGVPLKIDLISMLTRARKATQTAAIARTVQFAGSMVAAWPEARFKVNPEAAVEEFNDGVGSTSKIMRTDREVKKMIQQEAQQKQAAQTMEMTQQGAASAAALSKTSLAPGTALSALVGGGQ